MVEGPYRRSFRPLHRASRGPPPHELRSQGGQIWRTPKIPCFLFLPRALAGQDRKRGKRPWPSSLPDLPYPKDALGEFMSAETLDFHHGKHHRAYVDKTNDMLADRKVPAPH